MPSQDEKLPLATRLLAALNKRRDDPDKLKALLKTILGDLAPSPLETQIAELQKSAEADQEKDPTQLSDRTREVLEQIVHAPPPPPQPRTWQTIDDKSPVPILTGAGLDGPLLSVGMVGILAGAGGTGKSRLAAQIALQVATPPIAPHAPTADGLWLVEQGDVLYATYEDAPAITAQRIKALAARFGYTDPPPVHVLDLQGWPLFGAQNYQERPGRLEGFEHLAQAVETIQPSLIIIDPALCAYVADANNAAPVREFVAALATLAAEHQAAVLLVAHSTKAARSGRNETPDPFDAGQIGGSAAWHDAARAALVLTKDKDGDGWTLAISKANYGPAFKIAALTSDWPAFRASDSLPAWRNKNGLIESTSSETTNGGIEYDGQPY